MMRVGVTATIHARGHASGHDEVHGLEVVDVGRPAVQRSALDRRRLARRGAELRGVEE
jgi:hypothetical protein